MDNTNTSPTTVASEENSNAETKSKKVDRSAAHPAITIEAAIKFVGQVYTNFRNDYAKREDITKVVENSHNRHLAAASYYGLLNREKDTYKVSERYKVIANPVDDKEKAKGILSCLNEPKLYKKLIEKFDGAELPKDITIHLIRFYEITEDAAPLAGEVFIKNLKYCNVVNSRNELQYAAAIARLNDNNVQYAEVITVETENQLPEQNPNPEVKTPVTPGEQTKIPPPKNEQPLLPEMTNADKIRIRLTGGKQAFLIYPMELNHTDIEILYKQLEQLKLLI